MAASAARRTRAARGAAGGDRGKRERVLGIRALGVCVLASACALVSTASPEARGAARGGVGASAAGMARAPSRGGQGRGGHAGTAPDAARPLPLSLPFLRLALRGGGAKRGEDGAPQTPVTPGRASRRLMNVSPELKNASPSLLSGRRLKARARVPGAAAGADPGGAAAGAAAAGVPPPSSPGAPVGAGAPPPSSRPGAPAGGARPIAIRRSTFDKIVASLEQGKRASIKSGHGRRIAVVLDKKRGVPVTVDGRALVKGDDIRDVSSLSEEPEPELPAAPKPAANAKRPLKFEPRARAAERRPVGPVAGPEPPSAAAPCANDQHAPPAAPPPPTQTDPAVAPVAPGAEGPAQKKTKGSASPLPVQMRAGADADVRFDLGVLRANLAALRPSLAQRVAKGVVSQEVCVRACVCCACVRAWLCACVPDVLPVGPCLLLLMSRGRLRPVAVTCDDA